MTAWAKCPQCGQRTEVKGTQMHCPKCHARLDMSSIHFGKDKSPAVALLKRLLRSAVLVGLLAVLALLVWPTDMPGVVGSEADGEACFESLRQLYDAIEVNRPQLRVISEAEANAYLAVILASAEQETPLGLNMRSVNLSFTQGGVTVHILMEWGLLRLTQELLGVPRVTNEGFRVDIQQIRMGHLPLPRALNERMAARLAPLFAQMERERTVLDGLTGIDLGEQRVRLRVGR